MNRLYKVCTFAEITFVKESFITKKVKHSGTQWFTYKTKYVYANSVDEARMKYGDAFFNPMENGYNKKSLKCMSWIYDTKSNNMCFEDLAWNVKIKRTHESVFVYEKPVYVSIDDIKNKMTADDFKDWWHDTQLNNESNDYEIFS